MMTAGEYLRSVAEMHGLTYRAMARALKVDPAVLRRWRRGSVVPSWRRTQAMTALWGGDPHVIYLGTVLQRYCQMTGLTLEEARRLCSGRPTTEPRQPKPRAADRGQLALPIDAKGER